MRNLRKGRVQGGVDECAKVRHLTSKSRHLFLLNHMRGNQNVPAVRGHLACLGQSRSLFAWCGCIRSCIGRSAPKLRRREHSDLRAVVARVVHLETSQFAFHHSFGWYATTLEKFPIAVLVTCTSRWYIRRMDLGCVSPTPTSASSCSTHCKDTVTRHWRNCRASCSNGRTRVCVPPRDGSNFHH